MSVTISPVANNQSFGTWLGRTNQLTTIMSTNVVSTDNTVSGGITTGNGTVNGYFGASNLFVIDSLRGGNVTTSNTLSVISNAVFSYIGSNVDVTLVSFVANSSYSNVLISVDRVDVTGNTFFANNISAPQGAFDTIVGNTSLAIGSNVNVTTSSISIGNSTVNTYFTTSILSTNGVFSAFGSATLSNTISVTGSATLSNAISVTGNATLSNTISVTGNATLSNTLSVIGNVSISNSFNATGNATFSNTLSVLGNTTLSNTLTVSGNVVTSNTLSVTGNTTLANTLSVVGNVSLSNTFSVVGSVNFSNTANVADALGVIGAVTLSNTLSITGNVNLSNTLYSQSILFNSDSVYSIGNNSVRPLKIWANNVQTNNITVEGQIVGTIAPSGSIIPTITLAADLGSTSNYFSSLYVSTITANSLNIVGPNSSFNTNLLYIDTTNSKIGVNNTAPGSTLTVNGSIETTNYYKLPEGSIITSSTNTTAGVFQQTVDTFSASTYRSADYVISIKDNNANGYQITKMLIVHDGTSSYSTEYGTIVSNASLGIFATDISGGNVRLLVTPNSSNTTMKIIRTTLVV